MPFALQPALPRYDPRRRPWLTVFLLLVATLASTIRLKLGPAQYLELIYFAQIVIIFSLFVRHGYRTVWLRTFVLLGSGYLLFSAVAIALAFYSLRFHFAYPHAIPVLTEPVLIAFVRTVELLANAFIMLWLADLFRNHPPALRFTLRLYFWTGVLSAVYSLLSWPIALLGFDAGGVDGSEHRFRGFYNEGGPYGLYALSVVLLGIALYRTAWEHRPRLLVALPLLVVALILSASKAAIIATAVLLLLNGLFASSFTRRIAVVLALGVVFLASFQSVNFGLTLQGFLHAADTYERGSTLHPNDGNYVIGRVAGLFIVPRMVAAHPISGVGWGNYGLLRNLPEYRGASAFAFENDQPALGLLGDAAEFGIPLDVFLALLLFLPFFLLRRLRRPVYLTNLALLQPLVHLCGAQLNLTYPWIVTSFVLGLAYSAKFPATQLPESSNLTAAQ